MPATPPPAATWEDIDSVLPWKRNPRRNAEAISKVAAAIARFGFGAPILARTADRVVIAGHTRLAAAKKVGMRQVPVRFLDLDPDQAAALALADNKLGEIAEWDDAMLADVLEGLALSDESIEALGWSEDDLDAILQTGTTEAPQPLPDNVPRHETAIHRLGLSASFQVLIRFGYLGGARSFLDYGCGRGGDVKAARALGIRAEGYDPHYRPQPPNPADVVNLAFVLNVIEDPIERGKTLQAAHALAGEVLAVGFISSASGAAAGDGVITSKGTFQRVFTPEEAQDFISHHLPAAPFAWLGGGLCLIFASAAAKSEYLRVRDIDARPLD